MYLSTGTGLCVTSDAFRNAPSSPHPTPRPAKKHPLAHTIAATCLALACIALPSAQAAVGLGDFDPPNTPQGPSIQSYVIDAFNGSTQVASQAASQAANNILPNFNSGFALVDRVNTGGITSVTIHAVNPPGVWDFVINTVAFNQRISSVLPNAPPPPPPPVCVPEGPPPPVTLPPVTVTYTEPDAIDEHGYKQKGKTKTLLNQVINYGDDLNDAKGHFESLPSPVPESLARHRCLCRRVLLTSWLQRKNLLRARLDGRKRALAPGDIGLG